MAVTTAVLSGNVEDIVGALPVGYTTRVALWVECNSTDGILLDTAGGSIMAGVHRIAVNSTDGTFSEALVKTDSTDVLPGTGRLYRVHVDFPSGAPSGGRQTISSGWFPLTANATLVSKWAGLSVTAVSTAVYEAITDSLMTGVDANAASAFRVQSDARVYWKPAQAVSVGSVRQHSDGSWIKSTTARTTGATYTTVPLAAPVLAAPTTASTGGTLASGASYFYKATALNALGETVGSAEVSQAIAAALATPVNAAFSTATTGGTLAAATYSYRVSATNALGETLASTATTITTTGATSTVTVNWGAVTGATGYKVYGRTGAGELLIASVGAVTTYTDTGAVTPAGALPAANTTATATATVGLSWAAITGATGYKIYRATVAGGESTSPALVATLGAVTTYTDTGTAVSAGSVPATDTTTEAAWWTPVSTYAGTQEQVANAATYVSQITGNPEKIQLDGLPIDETVPDLSVVDGTVATPNTTTTYKTPMVYVERHTDSAPATSCDWGNSRKSAAILAEVVAYGAETGEVNGFASRVFSATAKPAGAQPLVSVSALAQSNAPAGQTNRDVFAANFIAASSSGVTPNDLVGVEVDVIPSTSVPDIRPGQVGAKNATAYWAQSGGGVNANTAFYASSTSGAVGWLYGMVIDAPVVRSTGYFRNTVNAAGNTGLYVETQYGAAAGYAMQVVAAANEQFRIDGASDNPVSIRVGSAFKNVVVGAVDSAGAGFRTLRVAN